MQRFLPALRATRRAAHDLKVAAASCARLARQSHGRQSMTTVPGGRNIDTDGVSPGLVG